jgi:hypothetical protein
MPVEIKELIIRAVVDLDRSALDNEDESLGLERGAPNEKEQIVEDCVRQVLRILEKSRER